MINAILQARTGSQRFPNKVLSKIRDMTIIEHIAKQVRASEKINKIILSTSDNPHDDALAAHAEEIGFDVYRGDEDKIMHRLLGAAKTFNTDIVVRLLGDCPLSDPQMIDSFVDELLNNSGLDMVTNQAPHSFPDGYDISVIRIQALEKACEDIESTGRPEHLSEFWREGAPYKVKNITAKQDYFSRYRVTLDYEKDLHAIQKIIMDLSGESRVLYLQDVLGYLAENMDVVKINEEYI